MLGEAEMKKLGMGALLGVGQGSERESQLVVMQWNGARKKTRRAGRLRRQGRVLQFRRAVAQARRRHDGHEGRHGRCRGRGRHDARAGGAQGAVNAVGVIGLVENMPDGKAQRPDDVVKSMSGQTIEVLNTDAEGRLVLADALWYAQSRFKPKFVIDLATLTGAIMVALGHEHAGLFSNDDKLSERIVEAGKEVGEPVWRLPLGPSYDKLLRSKIADMKNIGGPQRRLDHGGAVPAALHRGQDAMGASGHRRRRLAGRRAESA